MRKYCGQSCEMRAESITGRCNDLGVCQRGDDPVCELSPCWTMLMKYNMTKGNVIDADAFKKFIADFDTDGSGNFDESELKRFGPCSCLLPYFTEGKASVAVDAAGSSTSWKTVCGPRFPQSLMRAPTGEWATNRAPVAHFSLN